MNRLRTSGIEKHGFFPDKQVPVPGPDHPITIADFAVPEKRLAIYIDGGAFHIGKLLRRDQWIRERLRNGEPPWKVVELRVGENLGMHDIVESLKA